MTGRALEQRSSGKLLEQVMTVGSRLAGLGWRHVEQAAAGQEPEVADAVEVAGQDVEQEASDELLGREGQGLEAAVMAVMTVIAPAETDLAVLDSEEAVVGDGDAVGVAAEVVENLLRAGEGPLGVDDPLGLAERLEVAAKGSGARAWRSWPDWKACWSSSRKRRRNRRENWRPASEVMGPPSKAATTRRRPWPSTTRGLVVHCVGIGSSPVIWLTPFSRVFYQIPRTDATYLW